MAEEKVRTIALTGKLKTDVDASRIGENFQSQVNLRPQKGANPIGVLGMTKINSNAADATYPRIRNGFHFRKGNGESHVLVQGWNSAQTAAAVLQNKTAILSTGQFETADLFTDDTDGGTGRFSKAPVGAMAYCNGEDVCAFGGDEFNPAAVIQYDPDDGTKKWDFTRNLTNSDPDDAVALVKTGGALDSSDVLLLHLDNNVTDSEMSTQHTVTKNDGVIFTSFFKRFGTHSAQFSTGGSLTIPDSSDFDFSGGEWTVECWSRSFDQVSPDFVNDATLYYHETDDNNYMRIWFEYVNAANANFRLDIYSAGSPVVQLTAAITRTTSFVHYAVVESGDNYYLFINGIVVATTSDAGRPANYTGLVYIGNDNNGSFGEELGELYFEADTAVDEFRVSKIARWTSGFTPNGSAYPVSSVELFLGSIMPIDAIKVHVETANTDTSGSTQVHGWSGTFWENVTTLVDGTIDSGAILGQSGTITFDTTEDSAKIRPVDNMVFYWYRIQFQDIDDTTEISQITVSVPFQRMRDIWDGELRSPMAFMMWDESAQYFRELSVNVFEDNYDPNDTSTFADLGSGFDEANDYLIAGFAERQTGVSLRLLADKVNATTSSVVISYWSGEGWVVASGVIDNTYGKTAASTINKSGMIVWAAPDVDDERPRQDITIRRTAPTPKYRITTNEEGEVTRGFVQYYDEHGSKIKTRKARKLIESIEKRPFDSNQYEYALYFYKISFTGTIEDGRQIYHVGGITAQNDIEDYTFPFMHQDRLFLCGSTKRNGNGIMGAAMDTLNVFNGVDAFHARFGDDTDLVAGASVAHPVQNGITRLALLFKTNEIWRLTGYSPENFGKIQLSDTIGCVAPLTMEVSDVEINNIQSQVAIWEGANGIYMSDGRKPVNVSEDIDNLFDVTSDTYVDPDYAHLSTGTYDPKKNEYHWMFRSNSGDGTPPLDKEWVLNLDTMQWYEMDRGTGNAIQCIIPVEDSNGQTYLYGCDDAGFMYRLENDNDFDGASIAHELHTGDLTLEESVGVETRINTVRLIGKGKLTTAQEIAVAHYGDTSSVASTGRDGATVPTMDVTPSANKRLFDVSQALNFGPHTFHSLKFSITTDDEIVGFEPMFVVITYTLERVKVR